MHSTTVDYVAFAPLNITNRLSTFLCLLLTLLAPPISFALLHSLGQDTRLITPGPA
jgi:hypothetical protein